MSLDDRLDSYLAQISSPIYYPIDTKQAKQAILSDLLEIIGEDEPIPQSETGINLGMITGGEQRNQLRQELRDKVKEYCK